MYRINTFPFIHLNLLHTLMNVLALTPLLERFEMEHGTLNTVALFFGRKSCEPIPLVPWHLPRTERPLTRLRSRQPW